MPIPKNPPNPYKSCEGKALDPAAMYRVGTTRQLRLLPATSIDSHHIALFSIAFSIAFYIAFYIAVYYDCGAILLTLFRCRRPPNGQDTPSHKSSNDRLTSMHPQHRRTAANKTQGRNCKQSAGTADKTANNRRPTRGD